MGEKKLTILKIRTDMIGTLLDNDDVSLEYNIRYHQSADFIRYNGIGHNGQ